MHKNRKNVSGLKELKNLMGFRESIRVVDATLRDGGLVNEFRFSDEFVRALYQTNLRAGVDYMEVGYKADRDIFDVEQYGKWKFCDDDEVRKVLDPRDDRLKLAVMADVGRCNFRRDIRPKDESPFDLIRVATYAHQIPGAVEMVEDAKEKGYEVTCNLMAISAAQESDVRVALEMLCRTPVDTLYIVDSFGALFPEQIARIAELYMEFAEKYGKKIGIHAHNNLQLAFANTIEAIGDGVDWADATYAGMGRGAGNCPMENLLGFLRNPKYEFYPALQFCSSQMLKLKEDGVKWGYDWQYLATGLQNEHPRSAIAFTKADRRDYLEFYRELVVHD